MTSDDGDLSTLTEPVPEALRSPPTGTASGGLSIAQALGLLAVFVIAVNLSGAAIWALKSVFEIELDAYATLLLAQLTAWPPVMWLAMRWMAVPPREAWPLRRFSPSLVPALVAANVGAAVLLLQVVSLIPVPDSVLKGLERYATADPALSLIAGVLIAPVAEELFFRGQLFGGFRIRYPLTRAMWVSSLFFALFHLNPWQATIALPLGLFYAWLTLRTGSVLPGMLSHAVVNATGRLLIPALLSIPRYAAQKEARFAAPEILIVAFLLTAIGGYALWRQLATPRAE